MPLDTLNQQPLPFGVYLHLDFIPFPKWKSAISSHLSRDVDEKLVVIPLPRSRRAVDELALTFGYQFGAPSIHHIKLNYAYFRLPFCDISLVAQTINLLVISYIG